MKAFLDKLEAWLSPERRQAIYTANAALAAALVTLGVAAEDTVGQWLILAALVLQGISGALQLRNLSPTDFGAWFHRRGRVAIYGSAVTVAGVGVALGWFTEDVSAQVLSIVSVGLTALGAMVAVVQIKSEQALYVFTSDGTARDTTYDTEPAPEPEPIEIGDPPVASATRLIWAEYATRLGIVTEGLTKAAIREAVVQKLSGLHR